MATGQVELALAAWRDGGEVRVQHVRGDAGQRSAQWQGGGARVGLGGVLREHAHRGLGRAVVVDDAQAGAQRAQPRPRRGFAPSTSVCVGRTSAGSRPASARACISACR